ncbi:MULTISPECIES: DUF2806 domain-containing protein [Alphaproteobacteria]|uniref:DUF2806 domain-containing protein n=2 Tax=Alphaproteobacteria TaxID=28211 RepID=A0A512HD40_9HYPH|nr:MULTISPECIES: DUF2806 domain-containing protein [Alphaproteobacteria]GEO83371.1 hypothetical protein RNA01_03030 [Ciceribacter naphthalenivorans]GLR20235.1 hypothetical protein GCM10007920_00190 [Ciceribacter naphthalenivorans]GLT03091.1 hypothetical protein GCM10007926_00190 [Sphingomonas psychrolutea]
MTEDDSTNIEQSSHTAIGDFLGAGKVVSALIGPITQGVGKLLTPGQRRRDNNALQKIFHSWDDAFNAKGYRVKGAELSIAERADLRLTVENVMHQANREDVAIAAIEHAEIDTAPVDPAIPPPDFAWISRFWSIAEKVTDEDIQRFFGMVLSRRATRRSNVSARSLEFLSLLSREEAKALERIASLTIAMSDQGAPNWGVLNRFSLPVSGSKFGSEHPLNARVAMYVQPLEQRLFGSLGVFIEDGWAHGFYYWKSGPGKFSFQIGTRSFSVLASSKDLNDEGSFSLGSGVGLSPLGRELVSLIKTPADQGYIEIVIEAMNASGISWEETT